LAGRLREINTHLSEPGPERLVPGRELAPLISKVLVGHRAHHSGPKKSFSMRSGMWATASMTATKRSSPPS